MRPSLTTDNQQPIIGNEIVELEGSRLWTTCTGRGLPLILCHGGPGLWDYLKPVAAMVDDLATVYRYDQRGCGRSQGDGPNTVEQNIQDLEALRVYWGLDRWIVGGHSWGATLAMGYARAYPERTQGLIYLSGTGVSSLWHTEYRAEVARRLGPEGQRALFEWIALYKQEPQDEEIERAFCQVAWSTDFSDLAQGRSMARQMFVPGLRINRTVNADLGADATRFAESGALAASLSELRAPALIVHGAADPRPFRFAADVARLLPESEFVLIPEAGHNPWLERPEPLREALRAFILKLTPETPDRSAP